MKNVAQQRVADGCSGESGLIVVSYEGQQLIATNYWTTELAAKGFFYLSANAGAFGLLVPKAQESTIAEMKTAQFCAITKGFSQQRGGNMFEMLFDDNTKTPFQLLLCEEQLNHEWIQGDVGKEYRLDIYTIPASAKEPAVAHSMPCGVRNAVYVPYLKPWRGKRERYN